MSVVVINKKSEPFPSMLLDELLKHFNDYETLKTIQLSTSALNDLFSCPSQSVWKQLCARNRYIYLLKREARCLLRRANLIWESIYYQNWKVDLNWSNKNCEVLSVVSGSLMKMVNCSLGVSLDLVDGSVSVWDFKRNMKLCSKQTKGQITSSNLQGNWLVLGKSCGSMTVFKIFSKNPMEWTVKHHSKEISSILIDVKDESIISGDVDGVVIKSKMHNADAPNVILYSGESGVTGLHLKDEIIFVTTMDGSLIKIFKIIKSNTCNNEVFRFIKYNFDVCGSINCIASFNVCVVLGTDSGNLIILDNKNRHKIEHLSNSPIISIASSSKRIAAGHFDGNISVFNHKTREKTLFREIGPVWSVGIEESSLISCTINGETILRNFL